MTRAKADINALASLTRAEEAAMLRDFTAAALTGIIAAGRILDQHYQALNAVQTAIYTVHHFKRALGGEIITDDDSRPPSPGAPRTRKLTKRELDMENMYAEPESDDDYDHRMEMEELARTGRPAPDPRAPRDDESEAAFIERTGQDELQAWMDAHNVSVIPDASLQAPRTNPMEEYNRFLQEHHARAQAAPQPPPSLPSEPGESYDDYITRMIGSKDQP